MVQHTIAELYLVPGPVLGGKDFQLCPNPFRPPPCSSLLPSFPSSSFPCWAELDIRILHRLNWTYVNSTVDSYWILFPLGPKNNLPCWVKPNMGYIFIVWCQLFTFIPALMVSFLLRREEYIVTTVITIAPTESLHDRHFIHVYYLFYSNNIIAYKENMFSPREQISSYLLHQVS